MTENIIRNKWWPELRGKLKSRRAIYVVINNRRKLGYTFLVFGMINVFVAIPAAFHSEVQILATPTGIIGVVAVLAGIFFEHASVILLDEAECYFAKQKVKTAERKSKQLKRIQ